MFFLSGKHLPVPICLVDFSHRVPRFLSVRSISIQRKALGAALHGRILIIHGVVGSMHQGRVIYVRDEKGEKNI